MAAVKCEFGVSKTSLVLVSILTFVADQVTDIILAATFFVEGYISYGVISLVLTVLPNIVVQFFSARWNIVDNTMNRSMAIAHAFFMGTLFRYSRVLRLGLKARSSGDLLTFQQYYQQWSDVCMLRLFQTFLQSAPHLLFQLFVIVTSAGRADTLNITWAGISAITSSVSVCWGVVAYCHALRAVRPDSGRLGKAGAWAGLLMQTAWRVSLLSARIVSLVLLFLTLNTWALLVIFVHWLVMTAWIFWQNTDFCTNYLEERLYNAVVGFIYCFDFFNLKEGRSRYRMAAFYLVTVAENCGFVAAYCVVEQSSSPLTWFTLGAIVILVAGTVLGFFSLVVYYRFFHPTGPIHPCSSGPLKNLKKQDLTSVEKSSSQETASPGFTIKEATYMDEKRDGELGGVPVENVNASGDRVQSNMRPNSSLPSLRVRAPDLTNSGGAAPAKHSVGLKHSRSFKSSGQHLIVPTAQRPRKVSINEHQTVATYFQQDVPAILNDDQRNVVSPPGSSIGQSSKNNNNQSTNSGQSNCSSSSLGSHIASSAAGSPRDQPSSSNLGSDSHLKSGETMERVDSAYGTDSNRTASRNTNAEFGHHVSSSSQAGLHNVLPLPEKSPNLLACPPEPPRNKSASHDNPNVSGGSGSSLRRPSGCDEDKDPTGHNKSSSSVAFNNDTYMSIENASMVTANNSTHAAEANTSYASLTTPASANLSQSHLNNTYQSVHPPSHHLNNTDDDRINEDAEDFEFGFRPINEVVGEDPNASQDSQTSRITVIDRDGFHMRSSRRRLELPADTPPQQQQQELLKRSPVVRDITKAAAFVSSTPTGPRAGPSNSKISKIVGPTFPQSPDGSHSHMTTAAVPRTEEDRASGGALHAPLTIIIPNISHQAVVTAGSKTSSTDAGAEKVKDRAGNDTSDQWSGETIPLDVLNPSSGGQANISSFTGHDYENLALVNINVAPLGVSHWRTYSDMAGGQHDDSTKYERQMHRSNFTSNSDYSNYSTLAFCDIYPLTKAMKEQLYRSLTPVSTAATMASSSLDTSDSNHTYEPIETAEAVSAEARSAVNVQSEAGQQYNHPVTLIHHDGKRVTANKILSLENLREVLMQHEQVPYDDPEARGDLYILAPMRLLTPIMEESISGDTTLGVGESFARSQLYQSLYGCASNYSHISGTKGQPNTYGLQSRLSSHLGPDLDTSIMSIISEVLNVRNAGGSHLSHDKTGETAPYQNFPPKRLEEQKKSSSVALLDEVDSSSLLQTIEEIRNSSLCNLYYTANSNNPYSPVGEPMAKVVPAPVPRVPPRNTVGYDNLCKENQESRAAATTGLRAHQPPATDDSSALVGADAAVPIESDAQDNLNESLCSIDSNTLVVTPVAGQSPVKVDRQCSEPTTGGGCRKNIFDLVGATSTNHILTTPAAEKTVTRQDLAPGGEADDTVASMPQTLNVDQQNESIMTVASMTAANPELSIASETNEFRSLMPHLTHTGVKFLSRLKAASAGGTPSSFYNGDADMNISSGSDLIFKKADNTAGNPTADLPQQPDLSNVSEETPSPKVFERNSVARRNSSPLRTFSLRRKLLSMANKNAEDQDLAADEDSDNNSDYKYGFGINPDAKYGFGSFNSTDRYNVLETAGLSFDTASSPQNGQSRSSADVDQARKREQLMNRRPLPSRIPGGFHPALAVAASLNSGPNYSLSSLNRSDTAFKLHPEDTYEGNLPPPPPNRNRWATASMVNRRPEPRLTAMSAASIEKIGLGDRLDVGRRSMSILDDYQNENRRDVEKENSSSRLADHQFSFSKPPPLNNQSAAGWPPNGQKRRPLAVLNKTSPLKMISSASAKIAHAPQARVYKINDGSNALHEYSNHVPPALPAKPDLRFAKSNVIRK